MKKLPIASIVMFLLSIGAAAALEEQKPMNKQEGFMEWIKVLQHKIEAMAPKKTMPMGTGVAGIRGAKEDEKSKLYWKGKKGQDAVTEEELIAFRSAVDLAEQGKRDAAIKGFEDFLARYPGSPLTEDAKKTLEMVRAMEKKQ
jgi:TolA-binding protein